jgi:hypothetical protein
VDLGVGLFWGWAFLRAAPSFGASERFHKSVISA